MIPQLSFIGTKYANLSTDILLSLTRTSRVGYLRDIRRLTVALSRARLGLYIFGRREVFEACFELKEAFERIFQRPDKLHVVVGEMFGNTTRTVDEEVESTEMDGVEHLGQYVYEMTQAKIASLKAGTEQLPPPEVLAEGGAADEEDDEDAPTAVAAEEADADAYGGVDERDEEDDAVLAGEEPEEQDEAE